MRKTRIINLIMNICCGLIVCLVMGTFVLIRAGAPLTAPLVLLTLIQSFWVSYTVGDVIPSFIWGQKAAAKLHLKGIPAYFLAVAIHDFFMVTLISFFATFDIYGFTMDTIHAWWHNYLWILLMAYIVLLIIMKLFLTIALAVTKNIND